MPTHYVSDYDEKKHGKKNKDADPETPETVPASFLEDVTAKVVTPPTKATPKTSPSAKTKG